MNILDILFLIIAVLIIIVTMMQNGKSEGASASIMGGNARSFTTIKERGPELFLTRVTFALAGLFFFFAVIVRVFID